jgi:hypothetical protein
MWSPHNRIERYEESAAKDGYRRYVQEVQSNVPPERLIEWHPGDGWTPICKALDLPEPEEPFPHVNTTDEFLAQMPSRLGEE